MRGWWWWEHSCYLLNSWIWLCYGFKMIFLRAIIFIHCITQMLGLSLKCSCGHTHARVFTTWNEMNEWVPWKAAPNGSLHKHKPSLSLGQRSALPSLPNAGSFRFDSSESLLWFCSVNICNCEVSKAVGHYGPPTIAALFALSCILASRHKTSQCYMVGLFSVICKHCILI